MPTVRRRYQITITPEVERALEVASRRWPGEPPSTLILRLFSAGAAAIQGEEQEEVRRRRTAVAATSGKYDDAFHEGYLEDLRRDWPR